MATYLAVKNKVFLNGKHYISLDYGNTYSDKSFHKGLDLIADKQKSDTSADYIVAFADGEVVHCYNDMSGTTTDTKTTASMGNYVTLKHTNGYYTRYMHMRKGSVKVKVGDKVVKGQVLGFMGNTGNSNGRHLHFDISSPVYIVGSYSSTYDGSKRYYLDPKPFLKGEKGFTATASSKGNYEVTSAVNVRKGPGTQYALVKYDEFTASAKEQIQKLTPGKKPNDFPKGMKVTISETSGSYGKCPTGWICLKYCKKI